MDTKLNLELPRNNSMPLEDATIESSTFPWWDITGAFAGAIAYALMQENVPVRRTLVHVFVGTVSAIFLSPWVCEFFNVTNEHGSRGVTFLFGLFGIIACRTAISWAEQYAPEALSQLIRRFLGPLPTQIQAPPKQS